MGKRAEDLKLIDDPIVPTPPGFRPPPPEDQRDADWYRFLQDLDALRGCGSYDWADDTLKGIQESVEQTHRVSPGQRQAVSNIEEAGHRKRPRTRRYEGWNR